MVFRVEPHLERVNALIQSGSHPELRYACLELRLAIERIAYKKLSLRLGGVSSDEIRAWQPKRVIETLMELVDPHIGADFVLSVGRRPGGGDPKSDSFQPVGRTEGISPKQIGKYWHKLGSFLHMEKPSVKGQEPTEPDAEKLKRFVEEVLSYVAKLSATRFDAHFSENASLHCPACPELTIRNRQLLQDNDIVQCQNTQCDESFVTHVSGDEFSFKRHTIDLTCPACGEINVFAANKFLSLPRGHSEFVTCDCGERQVVLWQLCYGNESKST